MSGLTTVLIQVWRVYTRRE